jgi:hypothetical protein
MKTGQEETNFYSKLNAALRNEDRKMIKPYFAYLKLFDSGIGKLSPLRKVVWRGVNKDLSKSFKIGDTVTWWSVSSCSTSVGVIKDFISASSQGTLFLIECVNAKNISDYACFPNEDELILMPGTQFEVVANSLDHHGGLHVVHLKEIDEEETFVSVSKELQSTKLSATTTVHKPSKPMKTFNTESGNKYTGEVNENGNPHGWGMMWTFDGDRYEGRWENGNKEGHSVKYYSNGAKYDGNWVDDRKEGQGTFW